MIRQGAARTAIFWDVANYVLHSFSAIGFVIVQRVACLSNRFEANAFEALANRHGYGSLGVLDLTRLRGEKDHPQSPLGHTILGRVHYLHVLTVDPVPEP